MNRRRPPAIKVQSAAPAAPAKNTDAAAGDATSPQAQSSTVFVSPMSTTATSYPTTAGTTPQLPAAASGAPAASSSSSSSFAANVQNSETAPADRRNSSSNNNTRRPSALGSLPDSANEGSETAHSTSSPLSSTTLHRRPSQEKMRRRSSAASLDGTPGSPASRATAAKRSSTSDTSDRDGSAPQASAPAAAKSKAVHVLASPDREAFRRRLSAPTTLTVHTNKQKSVPSNNTSSSSTVSLNVVNLGARLPSYQTLESPQDDACAADLGVAQEGVDWERVDADPQELFRQRNRNAAPSQQERNGHSRVDGAASRVEQKKDAEPTLPAQPLVLSSSWSLVAPSPKSKENGSLSSTHSTEVPELAATGAPHDQAKAASAAETEGEEGNHAVEESPRQLGTSPPPWRVRENVTYTASSFSSMQTESVALDTEDPIDVRVNDDAAVVSGDGVVAAPQSSDELDQTLAPLQQERDDGDRFPGVLDVHDKNRQVTTAPSAASADAFAPRDGEVNIFVAVRIRPCSSAASASTGGSGSGGQKRVGGRTGKHGGGQDSGNNNKNNAAGPDALVGSCVHADARRGFVDCSTFIAAAVPGAGGGDTAAAAASADATAVAAAAAAGKQARTLRFFFDHILDEHVSQRELMGQIGQRAVERVLAGYHGTVMCYGQSGSGKTHTVVGPNGGRLTKKALRWRTSVAGASSSSLMATDTQEAEAAVEEPGRPAHTADAEHEGSIKEEVVRFAPEVGLLPRMLHALFSGLEAQRLESEATAVGAGADGSTAALASWRVTFSALELYNEELRDLLPQELKIASTAKNKTTTKKKKAKPIPAAEEGNSAASSSSPAAAAAANGSGGEGGVITSPIQATPLRKPRPGSASTPSSPPAGSRSTNRRGGPASPFTLHTTKRMEAGRSAGKTATAVDSANNSSVGPSPFARFPNYPGLFSSANSSGGEHLANLQSWGAEDLEVLNAVSSSDHDDDDDDDGDKDADTDVDEEDEEDDDEDDEEEENEEDSDEEEEEEGAGIDAVGKHPSGAAGDPRSSASPHGATHDQRYSLNSVLLSPPSQQRLGVEEAGEPDPSRPTVNDDDDDEYARGRLTIGQVISVSPSLARPSANISKGAKKSAGGTAESSPPAAAAGQGGKSSGKATMLQTRVGRRLAGATTTTTATAAAAGNGSGASGSTAAPKSPSPTQRVSAAKGSTSPVRKPAPQTATAAATAAQTTSSATAATSASAASSVAPSTKRGGKTTLKKPRSVTRPRPTASGASTTTSTAVMREAGGDVYIEGLREHPIRNLHEGMVAVRRALRRRQMASTELNSDSSRAHTFFFIRVEQKQWRRRPSSADEKGDAAATRQSDGAHGGKLLFDVRQSTLTLVDLAGSERVGHTGAHGLRLKEAQNINLSLSALGNVMRLLSASSLSSAATAAGAGAGGGSDAHIPYRDSKLTRILRSSLGGNAITFLLCNVSPDRRDAQETMSTLRFAKLSKTVKNKAKLNLSVSEEASKEGVSSAVLQRYKEARQAALEAAAAAQRKLAAAALDASEQQRKLRQLAAYAWWLEEQLGCVVNQVTAKKADTQRKRMEGGGPDEDKGAEVLEEEEDWWRLSPRPRTPPAQPATSTPQRSTSGSTKAKSSPQRQASASPPPSSPPASKTTKVRVTATHRSQKTAATATADPPVKSPESPNSYYWASPSAKAFLSAPYALDERQRELQSRLVAAAAAAGLSAGGAIATARGSVLTTVGGLTLAPSSPPQRQQDGLGGHNNTSVVNAAASSASARPSAPSLVSPSATPETQYMVQHDPLADAGGAASLTDAPAANATALNGSRAAAGSGGSGLQGVLSAFQAVSPPASFRESVRGASERAVDSAAESRLGLHTGHGASSGVFVSASSLADAGSPCLSAMTEAQSQRHSAAPPTPAAGPLHGQAVSNFAVALAEERRAREAAQAQLRAVELQNLLLRLRLATLDAHHQQQQQQQQSTVEAATGEKSPSPSPSLTRKPRSTANGAAVATTLSKSSQRSSGGAVMPGILSPLSDSAPFHRTSTSPPPPPSSSWPPHYDRRSVEASLETFLARCGFVPLDSRVKGDGGANAGKGSSHAPTAAAGGSLTSPTVTYAWSGAGVPPFQLHQHGVMESPPFRGSPLSSPYDTHSQRSITVNPDSVQKLRDGSRGRADDDESAAAAPVVSIARRRLDNSSDSDSEKGFDDTGSPPAICTVLAVVNTEGKPHHGGTAAEDKETHALQHNTQVRAASVVGGGGGDGHSNSNSSTVQGRGSVQRRPRAASSPSPEATPSAGSSGWGQQLLTSVRTTIETVRAMSSHENFYEPDDINVSADEGAISPPLEAR